VINAKDLGAKSALGTGIDGGCIDGKWSRVTSVSAGAIALGG